MFPDLSDMEVFKKIVMRSSTKEKGKIEKKSQRKPRKKRKKQKQNIKKLKKN